MRNVLMGGIFLFFGVLSLPPYAIGATARQAAGAEVVGAHYQAVKAYPGIFEPRHVYSRFSQTSWQGSLHPALVKDVTCYQAQRALARHGKWTGELKRDGSCGDSGEPHLWATGNFLNFRMAPKSP